MVDAEGYPAARLVDALKPARSFVGGGAVSTSRMMRAADHLPGIPGWSPSGGCVTVRVMTRGDAEVGVLKVFAATKVRPAMRHVARRSGFLPPPSIIVKKAS